jgi:hypothetical protein
VEEIEERKKHHRSTLNVIDRKILEGEFDVRILILSNERLNIYRENPHICQEFANRRQFQRPLRELTVDDRIVRTEKSRTAYIRRQAKKKQWIIGTKENHCPEIEFLTLYGEKDYRNLYRHCSRNSY